MQKGQREPDPEAAAAVVADGEQNDADASAGAAESATTTPSAVKASGGTALQKHASVTSAAEAHDLTLQDFLMKLPGITQFNYRKVLARVSSLAELASQSLPELEDLLGKANAKKFHTFIHSPFPLNSGGK